MTFAAAATVYFILPLVLTVLIEGLVGMLFKLSKKQHLYFAIINVATNLTVNLVMYFYRRFFDFPEAYIVLFLEATVVAVEWLLIKAMTAEKRHWLLFSVLANAASYLFGILVLPILF